MSVTNTFFIIYISLDFVFLSLKSSVVDNYGFNFYYCPILTNISSIFCVDVQFLLTSIIKQVLKFTKPFFNVHIWFNL